MKRHRPHWGFERFLHAAAVSLLMLLISRVYAVYAPSGSWRRAALSVSHVLFLATLAFVLTHLHLVVWNGVHARYIKARIVGLGLLTGVAVTQTGLNPVLMLPLGGVLCTGIITAQLRRHNLTARRAAHRLPALREARPAPGESARSDPH
ncbi:hypothetical protein [Deinococcus ficus]|uniref:Uncharacterized protein n=1 Tax=Deinococcus ficus TaxID=317577 RepID=A0A221T2Z8_9DEIO|nr:hypothetical protein [Deinococcus ficus]ASN83241.1 hypothetical protein DFI_18765 [Deinococcus ficus]